MIRLISPIRAELVGYEGKSTTLAESLQYTDKKVDWEIKSHFRSRKWFVKEKGEAAFTQRLRELKESQHKSLLFRDESTWTYSGLSSKLAKEYDDEVQRLYDLPAPKLIPWASEPEGEDRYYQKEAEGALIRAAALGPAGVEMGTGLGKSRIIRNLIKRLGLRTVVMAPSTNIAEQLYDDLVKHFGKAKVGFVGDGKKQYGKLITVAIGASLTRLEPGSEGWNQLSKAQVFCADESHLCPAATLTKVCFGLVAAAPYRFFFSGTQLRNDGLGLLLDAITGPIVYRMTVQEGVDQGFLAKPVFRMIWVQSDVRDARGGLYDSGDANDLTRAHVYYSASVNARAAELINKSVSLQGRPTLVLIDELEQFSHLLPHLRYEARLAHGGVTKENAKLVPEAHHKSDPKALVAAFNRGEFPVLVGTSCIMTGTDIQAVQTMIYLRQGKSEVEVKQSVGRCTRRVPGKEDCIVIDFGVSNVELLEKHANARRKIYDEIYPSYQEMRI